MDPIENISPLDGRYASKLDDLRPFFSELGLIRYRVLVEVEWFIFICNSAKLTGTKVWTAAQVRDLRSIYEDFDGKDGLRVKELEATTNHDVKAVEYFLRERFAGTIYEDFVAFIHFGCTSEDINNLAYALMLKEARAKVVSPLMTGVIEYVYQLARANKDVAMMSRTHGQTATPTTLGKELVNVVARLEGQLKQFKSVKVKGKMNGAVGNFNAHIAAYPQQDWQKLSTKFVQGLGVEPQFYTTQIEPHDYLAELFDAMRRFNTVLLDFSRDVWMYISLGYFKQKLQKGEVGSSTMPHKVNPIDFENSEGNLGVANALLSHMADKLPVSRWQRDLSDSTVQRNIGSAVACSALSYKNCIQGLHKLEVNKKVIEADLKDAWELLAEPIQTVMRKYRIPDAYEQLKSLSRGKKVTKSTVHKFVDGLKIPANEKKRLKSLTPATYIGDASKLAGAYKPKFKKT